MSELWVKIKDLHYKSNIVWLEENAENGEQRIVERINGELIFHGIHELKELFGECKGGENGENLDRKGK